MIVIAAAAGFIVHLNGRRPLVVHIQINQEGQPVPGSEDAPADPAGNGDAVCPPVSIAMAGMLTGPDAQAATNVKNGARRDRDPG